MSDEPPAEAWPPAGTGFALGDVVLRKVDQITSPDELITMNNVLLILGQGGLWSILTKDGVTCVHADRLWEIRMKSGSKSYNEILEDIVKKGKEFEVDKKRFEQQEAEATGAFR